MAKTGRPTFQINHEALRQLRESRGWTQIHVGQLLKDDCNDTEYARTLYKRIEKNGKTSIKTAQKLADIFDVNIELLINGKLPLKDIYRARIEKAIRTQFHNGNNSAIQEELKFQEQSFNRDKEAIDSIIDNTCRRIEAVQLTRNSRELEKIKAITGMSEKEILLPANAIGYWLLTATSFDWTATKLIRGYVREEDICKMLNIERISFLLKPDSTIQITQDGLWKRLEILDTRMSKQLSFELVRCQPNGKGMQWTSPTEPENREVNSLLERWAWSNANRVITMDGEIYPKNIENIGLRIKRGNHPYSASNEEMIISNLTKCLPNQIRKNWEDDLEQNLFIQNGLARSLLKSMKNELQQKPQAAWDIDTKFGITLFEKKNAIDSQSQHSTFYIDLIELAADGSQNYTPWGSKQKEAMGEYILSSIQNNDYPLQHEDDVIHVFKPIKTTLIER